MKKLYKLNPYSPTETLTRLFSKIGWPAGHLALFRLGLCFLAVLAAVPAWAQTPQTITSFTLVNAETNQDIRTLANGETIDLNTIQNGKINIRANASEGVESVLFSASFKVRDAATTEYMVDGLTPAQQMERKMQVERLKLENHIPYALFGATTETPYDYTGGTLAGGEITITATPYTLDHGPGGGGTAGTPLTQTFIVTPFGATTFILVNADTNEDIQEITAGATLDLQTLPTRNLNVRANTVPVRVGSVAITLANVHVQPHENHFPYALFGKVQFTDNYLAGTLPVGQHTLRAVPYGKTFGMSNTTGNFAGAEASVNFTVVDATLSADRGAIFDDRLGFSLASYPNPTPDRASISFTVAKTDQVVVEVFDLKGSLVSRLFEQEARAGTEYKLTLDAEKLPGGVYVCRLKSNQYAAAHRILINK